MRVEQMSPISRRRDAAHRKRRILYNNDGGDIQTPGTDTPEGLLNARTVPLLGTHVDTVLYCTHHSFNRCTHNTTIGEIAEPSQPTMPVHNALQLIRGGHDCLEIMTEFCRNNGLEAFWSMRMNDVHDGALPDVRSHFKREHPELLMGSCGDFSDEHIGEPRWWAAVDYRHPLIRRRVVELIEEVGESYDVDGIELDFYRHPMYFRQNRKGLPAESEQVHMMTELMRTIRKSLDKHMDSREQPLLLAIRVPDTVWTSSHGCVSSSSIC